MLSIEGRHSVLVNINCQPDGMKKRLGGGLWPSLWGLVLIVLVDVGRPILTV